MRYRTCQLLALTIEYLGDSELDDEICDRILESMHTRLSDKMPSVRVQAIKALSRLQDPSDKQCPIIKGETTFDKRVVFQSKTFNQPIIHLICRAQATCMCVCLYCPFTYAFI